MNKRLLAIYSVVFILIMIMLSLYRQSYNTLKIFTSDVNTQTQSVLKLQQLQLLLNVWLNNDPKTKDNLDTLLPNAVAYDSIYVLTTEIQRMATYQEQRLRIDSIRLHVRTYQRLFEGEHSEEHAFQLNLLRRNISRLSENSLRFAHDTLKHRQKRLEESTALLDQWLFWLLISSGALILLATFYSFNFLRLRRRAEGFSKALLENTNHGIISFDPIGGNDYKVTYCNEAALSLLRISDWRTKTLSTILPKGIIKQVRNAFYKVLTTRKPRSIEGYLVHQNERIWVQATIAPFEDGILVSLYNLNPVKSFEQKLTYQIHQLEIANDELQQYAYITSHDLQEPLRKIQMFSDLGINPEPGINRSSIELFNKISATASHMRLLIQTLLFFTKSTDQPNGFDQCDLNKLMLEIQNELEVSINEKGARITIGKLPVIQGSPIHLKLLFVNLLSNALKYSRQGFPPVINVEMKSVHSDDYDRFNSLDQTKMYVCVSVEDNGIGFKPEMNEKIFTIFQRLHSKNEIPGTGIGLAICRKIAHQHHGHIFAEGEENNGARFHVYLPIEQPK